MSIVFTISCTFGSGSSSVASLVCKLLDDLDLAISYTTRTPLVDSQDTRFIFTSREVFEHMIARQEFLEYVSICGNYYGTPWHYVQQARENGKDLLVDVDEGGVAQIKRKIPDAISILVLPGQSAGASALPLTADPRQPTFLRELLRSSLEEAFQEAFLRTPKPNPKKYDQVIINDRIEDSANELVEIIRFERLRRS